MIHRYWLVLDDLDVMYLLDRTETNTVSNVLLYDRCSLRNSEPGIRNPELMYFKEFGIGVF